MIVGFSRHGTGGGSGPVGYVTDKTRPGREDSPPEVLRGSPEATRNLIDSHFWRAVFRPGGEGHARNGAGFHGSL